MHNCSTWQYWLDHNWLRCVILWWLPSDASALKLYLNWATCHSGCWADSFVWFCRVFFSFYVQLVPGWDLRDRVRCVSFLLDLAGYGGGSAMCIELECRRYWQCQLRLVPCWDLPDGIRSVCWCTQALQNTLLLLWFLDIEVWILRRLCYYQLGRFAPTLQHSVVVFASAHSSLWLETLKIIFATDLLYPTL